jgi:hypothetical protein
MNDATTSGHVSPELLKVAERAKRHPEQRILALAHLIDEPALERVYRSLRRDAAVGVDGVTVEQYGEKLAENLQTLRARMKAGQYRHQPIRRVNIPKENGTSRPIGVSTVEAARRLRCRAPLGSRRGGDDVCPCPHNRPLHITRVLGGEPDDQALQ